MSPSFTTDYVPCVGTMGCIAWSACMAYPHEAGFCPCRATLLAVAPSRRPPVSGPGPCPSVVGCRHCQPVVGTVGSACVSAVFSALRGVSAGRCFPRFVRGSNWRLTRMHHLVVELGGGRSPGLSFMALSTWVWWYWRFCTRALGPCIILCRPRPAPSSDVISERTGYIASS